MQSYVAHLLTLQFTNYCCTLNIFAAQDSSGYQRMFAVVHTQAESCPHPTAGSGAEMRAAASTCGLRRTHMRTRPVLPRRLHADVGLTCVASLYCRHPGTQNGAPLTKQILLYTAMTALHASVAQGKS